MPIYICDQSQRFSNIAQNSRDVSCRISWGAFCFSTLVLPYSPNSIWCSMAFNVYRVGDPSLPDNWVCRNSHPFLYPFASGCSYLRATHIRNACCWIGISSLEANSCTSGIPCRRATPLQNKDTQARSAAKTTTSTKN